MSSFETALAKGQMTIGQNATITLKVGPRRELFPRNRVGFLSFSAHRGPVYALMQMRHLHQAIRVEDFWEWNGNGRVA